MFQRFRVQGLGCIYLVGREGLGRNSEATVNQLGEAGARLVARQFRVLRLARHQSVCLNVGDVRSANRNLDQHY